jgi:hypothetical protein
MVRAASFVGVPAQRENNDIDVVTGCAKDLVISDDNPVSVTDEVVGVLKRRIAK